MKWLWSCVHVQVRSGKHHHRGWVHERGGRHALLHTFPERGGGRASGGLVWLRPSRGRAACGRGCGRRLAGARRVHRIRNARTRPPQPMEQQHWGGGGERGLGGRGSRLPRRQPLGRSSVRGRLGWVVARQPAWRRDWQFVIDSNWETGTWSLKCVVTASNCKNNDRYQTCGSPTLYYNFPV